MSDKKIHFKVITHEKIVFDDYVDAIYSNGVDGEFGVLLDHIPFMTALNIGVTKIEKDGLNDFIATIGGIFQIKENQAVILTDEAIIGKDIDIARAKQAKERAEARLENKNNSNIDTIRAEIALAKALARIKASNYYIK